MGRTLASALVAQLVVAALLGADCGRSVPPPVAPPVDAGIAEAGASSSCAAACARLAELECPEGAPTKGGESCEAVCISASSVQAFPLACISVAGSVEEVRACGRVRCLR
jgi:hypothetical protein